MHQITDSIHRDASLRLPQVCNHPMLSYPCYADFDPTLLVRECGKMEVLDRLLVKLHATGHRVLLFSTMTKARTCPAVIAHNSEASTASNFITLVLCPSWLLSVPHLKHVNALPTQLATLLQPAWHRPAL